MKDQNKNQKAPETKLTDAQLGDVNAGKALANGQITLANKAAVQADGKLGGTYYLQGKVDATKGNLLGH